MKSKNNILLLSLLTFFALNSFSQTNHPIEGKWKEYWGKGEVSDIDYHDIFIIIFDSENIYIRCENRNNYIVRAIVFDGQELSFELFNSFDDDIIPYALTIGPGVKRLEGFAIDVRGVETRVKWKKIPDK